jgi:hypothetical protein
MCIKKRKAIPSGYPSRVIESDISLTHRDPPDKEKWINAGKQDSSKKWIFNSRRFESISTIFIFTYSPYHIEDSETD